VAHGQCAGAGALHRNSHLGLFRAGRVTDLPGMDAVSGSQGGGKYASYSSQTLKPDHDRAKVEGQNEPELIESAGTVDRRAPPNNNGPGIGGHLDVYG